MGGSPSGGSGGAASTVNSLANKYAPQAASLTAGTPGQGLGRQYLPQFQSIARRQGNLASPAVSPMAQGAMQGARTGAGYGAQTAADTAGFAQGLFPYAQQIGQMGFDPQKELYARTLQQTQEQQRAGQAARGIAMSPYGAGLEGDATRNFNIDWQNQQLKRATDAATSMEGLGASAFNLGSGATDLAASAGRMPYDARRGLMADKANAYSAVGSEVMGANQPRQQVIDDFLRSIGMAPGFTNAASGSQQASTQSNSSIANTLLSTIGKH